MRNGSDQRTLVQNNDFQTPLKVQDHIGREREVLSASLRPSSASGSRGLDPSECALLVLDCQPEGLSTIESAGALIFQTNSAIEIVRRHGGYVYFFRTAFDETDYRSVPSTNQEFSEVARERRFQNNAPGTHLHPGLAARPDDVVVRKTRLGSFSTMHLDERLTNLGITTLIMAGIHTSGTILTTVREAADRDYRVIILADCTSDQDLAAHECLLAQILPRQAEIFTTSRLYEGLSVGVSEHDRHARVG